MTFFLVDFWAKEFPEDVKEKLLRFGRAAVAVATMRGKSYLQIGSICMGIGGSIIDPAFIESYLGMRVESVDEVEIIRRMTEGIYDQAEFEKALAQTKFADGKLSFTKSFGTVSRKAKIYISEIAWMKMTTLLREFSKEVAWHATAYRIPGDKD